MKKNILMNRCGILTLMPLFTVIIIVLMGLGGLLSRRDFSEYGPQLISWYAYLFFAFSWWVIWPVFTCANAMNYNLSNGGQYNADKIIAENLKISIEEKDEINLVKFLLKNFVCAYQTIFVALLIPLTALYSFSCQIIDGCNAFYSMRATSYLVLYCVLSAPLYYFLCFVWIRVRNFFDKK
jgi:hypothetical protein